MIAFGKGERRRPGLSLRDCARTIASPTTLIILHSLAIAVEQLCARSPDAPSREQIRPKHCVICGQAARNENGILQLVGHGMYSRQVRGLTGKGWITVWIQRFLCLMCGRTMSLLPDWLHPWRWYGGPVIVEALYRHCILQESALSIGVRFGRPEDAMEWRSLRRWRKQLLISPTLWGWLGPRLGATRPAANRNEAKMYLARLLAEGWHSGAIGELYESVRRTLRDLVHNRKTAWPLRRFLPGLFSDGLQGPSSRSLPTEKDSGPGPP
jgi:hypothetical protein